MAVGNPIATQVQAKQPLKALVDTRPAIALPLEMILGQSGPRGSYLRETSTFAGDR